MSFHNAVNLPASPVYQFVHEAFPGLSDQENPLTDYYARHQTDFVVKSELQPGDLVNVDRAVTHRLSWALGAEERDDLEFPAPWRRGNEAIALYQQRAQYAANDIDEQQAATVYRHMLLVGNAIAARASQHVRQLGLADPNRSLVRGPMVEQQLAQTAIGMNLLEKAYFATSRSLTGASMFGKTVSAEAFKNSAALHARIALQGISSHVVEDVCRQVSLIHEAQPAQDQFSFGYLVERARSGPVKYAPHFPTGWLLGGVFGDVLVDGCLLAVNNRDSSPNLTNLQLRELITCTLLDTDNQLGIQSVGVYKSRRGYFCEFSLDDLSEGLRVTNSWSSLREQFHDFLLAQPLRMGSGTRMAMEANRIAQRMRLSST